MKDGISAVVVIAVKWSRTASDKMTRYRDLASTRSPQERSKTEETAH